MTKLLGGQIMFGDFLYVHLSTPSTVMFQCEKTSQMFGLTITDNGNGQVSLIHKNQSKSTTSDSKKATRKARALTNQYQ